uniref:Uncharacterized protein n=1 Tax=Sinocyclocheilus grahami TaxID=75366 RepID=A0A672KZT5_SINGR
NQETGISSEKEKDEFTCPVCLDLLKDPVTIQCGHSYCENCITDCWDQEDQMRVYSCPQCRQAFSPRPVLSRNRMLAEVTEKLKKRKRPADCHAGAGDVQCDVCTGIKYKAAKYCLMCLNAYCQNHFEQHESWFRGKRHKVTDATGQLQEMICQKHEKLLEVFCRTDQKYICMLCTIIEHKNHDTVSAAEQTTEKQEKTAVSRAEGQLERLEQEINDLRRRDAELEQLSHTQDHIQFLQDLSRSCCDRRLTEKHFIETFHYYIIISQTLISSCSFERDTAYKWLSLTLDLNTVNKHLRLSESNRVITVTYTDQPYPDNPDRFDVYRQVLCRESVCGRCYWELEWSGNYGVRISVTYKSISRKGGVECLFGSNDQSWSLICFPSRYSFWHNNIHTVLPVESIIRRIGVFVDHSAGTLSFYSVSDTMSLIHTVQTTFTQPLYPGFGFGSGSSVKLC